jgi:hypothetical protein
MGKEGACIKPRHLEYIGRREIIVAMNDDPEHGTQEPFFIGGYRTSC